MAYVATQQLAQIADLDLGPATSAMVLALSMFDTATKNTYLRRASGTVLAAYAKRMPRTENASFVLSAWGDFTVSLVVNIARWMMISDRGFNPNSPADKAIRSRYDDAKQILDEIIDITNSTPRVDPDAIGMPDGDDEGPLGFSEGGGLDEADAWANVNRTARRTVAPTGLA
jgi:hypothetical protein